MVETVMLVVRMRTRTRMRMVTMVDEVNGFFFLWLIIILRLIIRIILKKKIPKRNFTNYLVKSMLMVRIRMRMEMTVSEINEFFFLWLIIILRLIIRIIFFLKKMHKNNHDKSYQLFNLNRC
jgi:hypothetical protein